jgi:hypothetical protein
MNRYAYVRNNPVKLSDPTGHAWCEYLEVCTPAGGGYTTRYGREGDNRIEVPTPPPVNAEPADASSNPNQSLTTSDLGIEFIKAHEAFVPCLYNDGEGAVCASGDGGLGNCTIGYGHKVHDGPCEGFENEDEACRCNILSVN